MRAVCSGHACFGLGSSYVCFRTCQAHPVVFCFSFFFPQTVVRYLG